MPFTPFTKGGGKAPAKGKKAASKPNPFGSKKAGVEAKAPPFPVKKTRRSPF